MQKPQDYREERIIARETPYKVEEGAVKGPYAGSGVLSTGRVVWLQAGRELPVAQQVSAFAEGIGVISLQAEALYS